MMKRRFITFEGIEGCGKSTQIRRLRDVLSERGIPVLLTEEPGGSGVGKILRGILLNRTGVEIAAEAELLLFMADRAQHIREVIEPALNRQKVVLCDRFADATMAYQGFGRGLDREMIDILNRFALRGVTPDLTLLMDVPVETGLGRALARIAGKKESEREDRFESEQMDFHRRVRDGYLHLASREPERFRIIDASGDIEATHRAILREVEAFMERGR